MVVVNAGIGGNRVVGPNDYAANPIGGRSWRTRSASDRDVLDLSGVTSVIWLEGINDLGTGATVEAVTRWFSAGRCADESEARRGDWRDADICPERVPTARMERKTSTRSVTP